MKKILTLNDLRFYIGSPCSVTVKGDEVMATFAGMNLSWATVVVVTPGFQDHIEYKPESFKLILRRFESLSRHEVEGLNKLWPIERISRTTFDSIKLDAGIIEYLTGLNVDVFGWIDQGLAIDAAHQ